MRHRDNRKDRKLARKADNVLRLLQLLEKENLVVLAGVEESNYADADFEKIMACASRKQPMMLITQDRELAAKIQPPEKPSRHGGASCRRRHTAQG